MTKQPSDETVLKYHLTLGEGNKISPSVTEAIANDALVINSTYINSEQEEKRKRALVKTKARLLRSRLERIVQRLYDLEADNEPEKPLNIDFDLYQMENF